MLPKTRRLSDDKTIEKTKLYGKVYSCDIASLIVDKKQPDLDTTFCVIVSTKVSKKATERNSLKRKVFYYLENNLNKFKEGFSVLIIVKKRMFKEEQEYIGEELSKLVEKANIIK